jgi:carbamoyltransferase
VTKDADLLDQTAQWLAAGKVVGWFQGRMEFGPRALGNRSILGDARAPVMQAKMNVKIKFRESFRPFAPAILLERMPDWFDWAQGRESPYMLLVAAVRSERRLPLAAGSAETMWHDPDLRKRVNIVRSTVPAITHVDYSARLQTVDRVRNPRFHGLLSAFERLTGCPLLVNTSFNIRGEPIVCTPQDAYRCFMATDLDVLVMEDCVVHKEDVRSKIKAADVEIFREHYPLD